MYPYNAQLQECECSKSCVRVCVTAADVHVVEDRPIFSFSVPAEFVYTQAREQVSALACIGSAQILFVTEVAIPGQDGRKTDSQGVGSNTLYLTLAHHPQLTIFGPDHRESSSHLRRKC
jgi:hypothetical protein